MVFPIYAYGTPVLRKKAKVIQKDHPELDKFVADMFETMYKSDGLGLAAPQAGKSLKLFVLDTSPLHKQDPAIVNIKKAFINPVITEKKGEPWYYNEGCLSLPGIREDIKRPPEIRIQYYDEHFDFFDEVFDGVLARVIQHEYDHLEGILFTDHVPPLKKKLLNNKLKTVSAGKVKVDYKMVFPKK